MREAHERPTGMPAALRPGRPPRCAAAGAPQPADVSSRHVRVARRRCRLRRAVATADLPRMSRVGNRLQQPPMSEPRLEQSPGDSPHASYSFPVDQRADELGRAGESSATIDGVAYHGHSPGVGVRQPVEIQSQMGVFVHCRVYGARELVNPHGCQPSFEPEREPVTAFPVCRHLQHCLVVLIRVMALVSRLSMGKAATNSATQPNRALLPLTDYKQIAWMWT